MSDAKQPKTHTHLLWRLKPEESLEINGITVQNISDKRITIRVSTPVAQSGNQSNESVKKAV
jgi:hypothetical protein